MMRHSTTACASILLCCLGFSVPAAEEAGAGFSFSAEAMRPLLVASGERTITTRVDNHLDHPVTAKVTARCGLDAELNVSEQACPLPAEGSADLTWRLRVQKSESLADIAIQFSLYADNEFVASETVAYSRPLQWVVTGPFPADPNTAHRAALPPEWDTRSAAVFSLGTNTFRWEPLPPAHLLEFDGIDFADLARHRSGASYAMTRLLSQSNQDVELRVGSEAAFAIWLNGEPIFASKEPGLYRPGLEVVPAALTSGVNTLVVKVAQDGNRGRVFLRITDANGAPVRDLRDGFRDFADYGNGP